MRAAEAARSARRIRSRCAPLCFALAALVLHSACLAKYSSRDKVIPKGEPTIVVEEAKKVGDVYYISGRGDGGDLVRMCASLTSECVDIEYSRQERVTYKERSTDPTPGTLWFGAVVFSFAYGVGLLIVPEAIVASFYSIDGRKKPTSPAIEEVGRSRPYSCGSERPHRGVVLARAGGASIGRYMPDERGCFVVSRSELARRGAEHGGEVRFHAEGHRYSSRSHAVDISEARQRHLARLEREEARRAAERARRREEKLAASIAMCGMAYLGEEACSSALQNQFHVESVFANATCGGVSSMIQSGEIDVVALGLGTLASELTSSDSLAAKAVGYLVKMELFRQCVDGNMSR